MADFERLEFTTIFQGARVGFSIIDPLQSSVEGRYNHFGFLTNHTDGFPRTVWGRCKFTGRYISDLSLKVMSGNNSPIDYDASGIVITRILGYQKFF